MGGLLRNLFLAAVGLFLSLPILIVCSVSLNEKRRMVFPPENITLKWYGYFFDSSQWTNALTNSLIVGLSSALLATAIALPLAWYLWYHGSRYSRLLAGLATVPFMLPPVIIAIGFLLFWGTLGHVGQIENQIIAHGVLFGALPLVTITVGLNAIERPLLDAARTLGADELTVFRSVVLPLVMPYMVSGLCFALVLSLNEYIVAYMVAGFAVETLPIKMLNSLRGGFTPAMSVGSVLFLVAGLAVFSLIACFGDLPKLMGADSGARHGGR